MRINPYLLFNGNCKEAFEFYAATLGAKIEMMMTHAESPMAADSPPEHQNLILHACLKLGNELLMASDCPPNQFEKPQGFSVSLGLSDIAEAERIYKTLSENGQVMMPLQQTFWAARFGMFVDRFGTPWMINCNTEGCAE